MPYPVGHRKRDGLSLNDETTRTEREVLLAHELDPAVAKALASEAFRPDRDRAMTIRYDPSEYPLLDAFCDLVGERHLATVHERWRAHDRGQSHLEEKRALLSPLAVPSAKRDAVEEVYDRLVREVVLPAIAERQRKHQTRRRRVAAVPVAAFPCARAAASVPTIRCHVDACTATGRAR